jgi:hypothetical protein
MGLLDNFLEYELYSNCDWNRFTISLRDKYTREVEYDFYDKGLNELFKKAKGLRTWRLDHYESAGGRYLAFIVKKDGYYLIEAVNGGEYVSHSEKVEQLLEVATNHLQLFQKISKVFEQTEGVITFLRPDIWGGEVEEEWHFEEKLHGLFTFSCPTGSGFGAPKNLTLSLFNEYKKMW